MKTRFILGLILLLGLYLIVSFSRDLWVLTKKENEISQSQLKLEKLRWENEKLRKELEYVHSEAFIEKEAREKLGLTREGETVLMLPENLKEWLGISQPQISGDGNLPNWKRWLKIFF